MSKLIIEGGNRLGGSVVAAGNKNAALPLLAACALTSEPVTYHRLPDIGDVHTKIALLEQMGVQVNRHSMNDVTLQAKEFRPTEPDPDLVGRIRTSVMLAGPLLARRGYITLTRPGGDRIGNRRLDSHFNALKQLGTSIEVTPTSFVLRTNGLKGADIFMDEMSVTGTEQAILASVLADGVTTISNAASEPHVQELCRVLNSMGAKIEGIGTNSLAIAGVERLKGIEHTLGPDYMEVGSWISLAATTRSALRIVGAHPSEHIMTRMVYERLGVTWQDCGDDIIVPADQELRVRPEIDGHTPVIYSMPWPGFPTDIMSVTIVLATQVAGKVLFHEKLFDKRMVFVDRLLAMGARIVNCDPHRVLVIGPSQLYGEELFSPDIRAGIGLVIAALAAQGRSIIQNIDQIDRGYEHIERRLLSIGARIKRVD